MAIQLTMTADQLGRSRFVISPAQEVASAVRHRDAGAARHARPWYHRARDHMEADRLALLEALVPSDDPYAPDFLTPPPTRHVETIDDLADRIATTPAEDIERRLDIALRERPVRPDVAMLFANEELYGR